MKKSLIAKKLTPAQKLSLMRKIEAAIEKSQPIFTLGKKGLRGVAAEELFLDCILLNCIGQYNKSSVVRMKK